MEPNAACSAAVHSRTAAEGRHGKATARVARLRVPTRPSSNMDRSFIRTDGSMDSRKSASDRQQRVLFGWVGPVSSMLLPPC